MDYDAIFIGSGMGAQAAAAALVRQRGLRCLILERHFKAGGFTHAFQRPGGYSWDVGVHYIGRAGEGMTIRRLFDYLTEKRLAWHRMPDDYDVYDYPDLRHRVPSSRGENIHRLCQAFPHEARGIRGHFKDLDSAARFFNLNIAKPLVPKAIAPLLSLAALPFRSLALGTVETALRRRIKDPKLAALLASTWGNYGVPPNHGAFAVHGVVATHYDDGGWYPVGGGDAIWNSIAPLIEGAGGKVQVSSLVTEVVMEDGKAVGVKFRPTNKPDAVPEEVRARLVISDAGAWITYGKLLPPSIGTPVVKAIESIQPTTPALTLYLGLSDDPRRLGVKGENYWMFDHFDHASSLTEGDAVLKGRPRGAFLSFPSLKDPKASAHTAEIIAFPPAGVFDRWKGSKWKKRGAEYEDAKARIAEGLLAFAERRVPGLSAMVRYSEVSTPLTTEDFLGHPGGTIYGVPAVPGRFDLPFMVPRTPVPGLYLTGADVGLLGITGALMGGLATAATVMGPGGWPTLMKAANKPS